MGVTSYIGSAIPAVWNFGGRLVLLIFLSVLAVDTIIVILNLLYDYVHPRFLCIDILSSKLYLKYYIGTVETHHEDASISCSGKYLIIDIRRPVKKRIKIRITYFVMRSKLIHILHESGYDVSCQTCPKNCTPDSKEIETDFKRVCRREYYKKYQKLFSQYLRLKGKYLDLFDQEEPLTAEEEAWMAQHKVIIDQLTQKCGLLFAYYNGDTDDAPEL